MFSRLSLIEPCNGHINTWDVSRHEHNEKNTQFLVPVLLPLFDTTRNLLPLQQNVFSGFDGTDK